MFFENGKAVNQAAKTVARFMAEKGIKLAHHDALDLIARLQGFPSHTAANARLEGVSKGTPQALKSWTDLFQVIACMNASERDGSITLTEGCDDNGNAEFFQSDLIIKATDSSIAAAADGVLERTDFVLLYNAKPAQEQSAEAQEQTADNQLAHRIAMQAELLSAEPGVYGKVYAAMRRNPVACIQEFDRKWDVSLLAGPWVIYSQKEAGYWHHNFGWVGDRDSAAGYPEESAAHDAARFVGVPDAEVRHEP
jgi:hypothetical protein